VLAALIVLMPDYLETQPLALGRVGRVALSRGCRVSIVTGWGKLQVQQRRLALAALHAAAMVRW
jgi:hypothetical protein